SMLTPKYDQVVTTLPKMASVARPRSRTRPPQRACRMSAFQITIINAPFSFGSQPQNRPHDWSAQMPPRTVPTKLNNVAKQTMAYTICANALPSVALPALTVSNGVKTPRTTYVNPNVP